MRSMQLWHGDGDGHGEHCPRQHISLNLNPFSPPQALVFERPCFEGKCVEIDDDVYDFREGGEEEEGGAEEVVEEEAEGNPVRRKTLCSVGSIKILRGL